MANFKNFFGNIQHNINKENVLRGLRIATGAILYPIVPTAIEAFSKGSIDMSGWATPLSGLALGVLAMGIDEPLIAYGAWAAMGTHILYVKGNQYVTDIFGRPIPAFDKTPQSPVIPASTAAQIAAPILKAAGVSDGIPAGYKPQIMPDGSTALVHASAGVSDFLPKPATLNDYMPRPGLKDYMPQPGLKDYMQKPALSDKFAYGGFEQDWSGGNFAF